MPRPFDRRDFMTFVGGFGVAGTLLPGLLWAEAESTGSISREALLRAEEVAGISFTDEERDLMLEGLGDLRDSYRRVREVPLDNAIPPALRFDPLLPGMEAPASRGRPRRSRRDPGLPADEDALAFLPVAELGELIRRREITSERLTRLYLGRLERYDPLLQCVVTLTEERALRQAREADREIAEGRWRGPLHGIPWGAKDLLAVPGYPTTWGATPFREQVLDETATVVERLDAAGAVLVAKLTLGALAWGDVWFGGTTKNPWNPEQGSSGSSAGPASATAAGLVGFSIGSETWGSIVSPADRCGATGLRPTFGRVSRHGAMALSWSMDKLGPICRSVEDCALVLHAIHGADGRDPTARTVPFPWDGQEGLEGLRIGYVPTAYEGEGGAAASDRQALDWFQDAGVDLVPMDLPRDYPLDALRIVLNAEAAAAFDELTRSGMDDDLVRQTPGSWPNSFRTARFIPAVEYIQANRVRTMVMGAMHAAMDGIDVLITPSYAEGVLLMTNLTGHPAVVVPNGFDEDGSPVSFSFVGGLWKEAEVLRVARAYQEGTGHHLDHPPLFVG